MSKRVLVVEDDADLRNLLRSILEGEGYDVDAAHDGYEALRRLDHRAPDLIVLDLMMPRLDGAAFVAQLEQMGLRPGIPILVLSAAERGADEARRIGAEAYVSKPFELLALLDQIARLGAGSRR